MPTSDAQPNQILFEARATNAVSRDKSARRFAQDDGFVGGVKTEQHPVRCAENAKESKEPQALRMTSLSEFWRKTS
jgi:hypothetical protein